MGRGKLRISCWKAKRIKRGLNSCFKGMPQPLASIPLDTTARVAILRVMTKCQWKQLKGGQGGVGEAELWLSIWECTVHHIGESMVAEAWGSWSQSIHGQEAESTEHWCSVHLLLFLQTTAQPSPQHGATYIRVDLENPHKHAIALLSRWSSSCQFDDQYIFRFLFYVQVFFCLHVYYQHNILQCLYKPEEGARNQCNWNWPCEPRH